MKKSLMALLLSGILVTAIPGTAQAADYPRIDIHVTFGSTTQPCVRDQMTNSTVRYTCRKLDVYGPFISYWSDQLSWVHTRKGDISGGDNWVDFERSGRLLEGCTMRMGYDICTGMSSQPPRFKTFQTGNSYYSTALNKWARNQSIAAVCLTSLFTKTDPNSMVTNCT